jgi:hypothetical protein
MEQVEQVEEVGPAKMKRRDLMDNIKSRVNAGYNVSYLKKNEKDLREKVKFFEKKEATGDLKGYMRSRYNAARELLGKIMEIKTGEPAPAVIAAPAPVNLGTSANFAKTVIGNTSTLGQVNLAPSVTGSKKKKSLKIRAPTIVAPTSPIFNPPPASPVPLAAPRGEYTPNGTFRFNTSVRSPVEATAATSANNAYKFGFLTKGRNKKTMKKRPSSPIVNEFLFEATQKFLPLPELYDPYTGRKFAPEEDPMPEIERAYTMLIDIYTKAHRKAATLRKKAAK